MNKDEFQSNMMMFENGVIDYVTFTSRCIEYINSLEAENEKLQEPKVCDGCKHNNGCEIKEGAIHYLSWLNSKKCGDKEFGCNFYEPKAP